MAHNKGNNRTPKRESRRRRHWQNLEKNAVAGQGGKLHGGTTKERGLPEKRNTRNNSWLPIAFSQPHVDPISA